MKYIIGLYIALIALLIGSWVVNLNKLFNCDFASPYKCEVTHSLGIIPALAPLTVWFGDDL